MIKSVFQSIILAMFFIYFSAQAQSALDDPKVRAYIKQLSSQGFNQAQLNAWFKKTQFDPSVIQKITTPYEAKPWYLYRDFFITEKRINAGKQFEKANKRALNDSEKAFGVPSQITVAIIGVETFYGQMLGKYPVMNALTTLAFQYPPREKFFRKELTEFLLLCKQHNWDPLSIQGSYAGAMGLGQFMPSSYRAYSVNFDQVSHSDLFNSPTDAIGSVANYLKKNGWQANQAIATEVKLNTHDLKKILLLKNKRMTVAQWRQLGLKVPKKFDGQLSARLLILPEKNQESYWLVFHNFEVIKRYNTSDNYVMVVYTLTQAL